MAQVNHVEKLAESNLHESLIPPTWETEVRELDMSHRREAGLSLAQSFATDPLSLYLMCADDATCWSFEKTWKLHVRTMQYSYASYRLRGIATTIGGDYDAIALWYASALVMSFCLRSTLC
jgi:hypothetical protein